MVTYPKPQQRKKEESKTLRGEGDQIKFIDLGLETWHVARLRKQEDKTFHESHLFVSYHTNLVSDLIP